MDRPSWVASVSLVSRQTRPRFDARCSWTLLIAIRPCSFGAFLAIYHGGIGWLYLHEHKTYTAIVYSVAATVLLGMLAYVHAVLSLQEPPSPPEQIPDKVKERLVVYECIDQDGEAPKCQKGVCKGRWKPSRTHHCSTCGQCRLGFDHHCLWLGNCVTMETRRMFLFLTGVSSLTIFLLSSVVIRPVWGHVNEALRVSYANDYANDMWWHRWYSWVLVAGPFGRWPVGVAYGYILLARQSQPSLFDSPGSLIIEPSITLYMVLLVANALSLFTLASTSFTFYAYLTV
ncbi:hypothetical protein CPB86DRAFT_1022 [Serendipita vermifera]|nr:hypothetical protein CPB86DRAFT_1022 [Serendipita vermifera]